MRQEAVILCGFTSLKRGKAKEEITPDPSGLIAFDAENGQGKTPVLDNLHPCSPLPSGDNSLQHYIFPCDSHKECNFY